MLRLAVFFLLSIAYLPLVQSAEDDMERVAVYPDPEDDWLFGFHGAISDSVHGTAAWFDSFFATQEVDGSKPQTSARIRLGFEPRARDFDVFTQKFRLRVRLPNLSKKVDLIFSDEAEDDKKENQVDQGRDITNDKEDSFTAAIRLINVDKLTEFIDTRIGISGGDLFTKARIKYTSDFSDIHEFEFQPSIYYYLDDGFGQRLFVEYDYNFAPKKQYRMNYSMTFSERYEGHRWRNTYSYLHQIDRFRATALSVSINGEDNGDRGFVVDNYAVSFRYRVNAYRKWLYFEVEPFMEWPEEFDYKITPGIALRVEGYFTRE
ncbi:hypothetical protein [Thalassomonas sp. M1454]|uniref:hypothetical protein n=1 Tax=Thalassomonas sp. M1454 TaxID=2594477 RepID=UPI0011804D86|nr:hypothetical protein [Thalassomonas sp. M1454]TRX55096.1 hypothetical protein FNN08_10895 [Thalassomonas sp. M1454]